jgi:hypothetical protein
MFARLRAAGKQDASGGQGLSSFTRFRFLSLWMTFGIEAA